MYYLRKLISIDWIRNSKFDKRGMSWSDLIKGNEHVYYVRKKIDTSLVYSQNYIKIQNFNTTVNLFSTEEKDIFHYDPYYFIEQIHARKKF